MLTNNAQLFLSTYKEKLKENVLNNPTEYAWPISELDAVFDRMKNAIIQGSFNKDSKAFRDTCKALKIKHTYRDIENFLGSV